MPWRFPFVWFLGCISTVVAVGTAVFGYLLFVQKISPLVSNRLLKIETAGTGASAHLFVTRELCLTRGTDGEAFRIFRRVPEAPGELEEVFETIPTRIHLNVGCTIRARRIDMPDSLTPGRYSYQTGLRFCNAVGRCETEWLPPAMIVVDGDPGRHTLAVE